MRAILAIVCLSAGSAVEIPHSVDGTLAPAATPADVKKMLVVARWNHSNPDKMRSTWESKWLEFDANGSVDITTMYAWGPRTTKSPWHVTNAGSAPAIEIDGVAYGLAPCKLAPRTTCLVGPLP